MYFDNMGLTFRVTSEKKTVSTKANQGPIDWPSKIKEIMGRRNLRHFISDFYSSALPIAPFAQAPHHSANTEFFFDDFHHQGAFLQSYASAFAVFGYQKTEETKNDWFVEQMGRFDNSNVKDGYQFYLEKGPLQNLTDQYHSDNFFWKQIIDHPNYDDFWQQRNLCFPHLKNVKHAVMTVGGWLMPKIFMDH